jgi:glycosyltransferase involved in cell wall biosynthesis
LKKKLFITSQYYLPTTSAGGIVRTLMNLVSRLSEDYEIFIYTGCKDVKKEYISDIPFNQWLNINNINIYYSDKNIFCGWHELKRMINIINPDSIFVNGLLSVQFSIVPIIMNFIYKNFSLLIVAPRGMLKSSALRFKRKRKLITLKLLSLFLNKDNVKFQATDFNEEAEIKKYFLFAVVEILSDLPEEIPNNKLVRVKQSGILNLLYLGRIHPIKNLKYLLQILKFIESTSSINLVIAGQIEDNSYWTSCLKVIENLAMNNDNIRIKYLGNVNFCQSKELILNAHLLVSPTLGENFGFSIVEALQNGCPVLISDCTPWRNLSSWKAGYDISLNDKQLFTQKIQHFCNLGNNEFQDYVRGSVYYFQANINDPNLIQNYTNLFFNLNT